MGNFKKEIRATQRGCKHLKNQVDNSAVFVGGRPHYALPIPNAIIVKDRNMTKLFGLFDLKPLYW
jgi:hypothetical protein